MKKIFIIIPLIILVIGGFLVLRKPKRQEEKVETPKGIEQINVLAIAERPYMTLAPSSDGHFLNLVIVDPKEFRSVDYEFEYQAGTSIKGGIGSFDLTEAPPYEKEQLLGTKSKDDYYFDENVSGGSFTFRFSNGKRVALKADFTLQNAGEQLGKFSSRDLKVSLDVGKTGLPSSTFMVTTQTMGLPAQVEGEVLVGPYGFFSSGKSGVKAGTLTFQSKKDLTGAKILAWLDDEWQEITEDLEIEEGKISATVSQLTTFVVVRE